VNKAPDAFRTISEVADELELPQHVLRFWETRFSQIRPMKRGGGRRYYRPEDVDLLRGIRHLLYGEGYTIRGVQRILKDHGTRFVQSVWQAGAPQPAQPPGELETEPVAERGEEQAGSGRGLFGLLPSLLGREDEAGSVAPAGRRERQVEEVGAVPDNGRARVGVLTPTGALPLPVRPGAQDMEGQEAGSAGRGGLTHEQVRSLQETMFELIECRRLIDAALSENS
jgi:DNA-binding transcriptional MerR regulator